ncbi:MAG TPA: cytochrome d ubiquinol oxidase subunit II [Fimbriimonadaceae bacterium]|nr:cytochrome d ubiquinol oxidase subunit II [Fimbriimonadaceae bacterium]
METVWFTIVSLMLATYVVLDGFDFGAGILHLFVAKNDDERRTVITAIGPLWDGNEVWLLAGGGVLVFAFPKAYAAGFSGFYLPLMLVLWLLVLRGISIEFRSMEKAPLWRSFWDGVFFLSSTLMAIVLGAALGNVIRGVPIGGDGYFSGPLFTDFRLGKNPGVLDWYTVTVGLFTLAVLAMHGALYLRMKTEGSVRDRSEAVVSRLWLASLVLGIAATVETVSVRPKLFSQIGASPLGWILAVAFIACFVGVRFSLGKSRESPPFLLSCGFIALMLAATAFGLYPTLLSSTIDPDFDLTIANATSGQLSLHVGIVWWILAMILAVGYFIYLFRSFRGKVDLKQDYGH